MENVPSYMRETKSQALKSTRNNEVQGATQTKTIRAQKPGPGDYEPKTNLTKPRPQTATIKNDRARFLPAPEEK